MFHNPVYTKKALNVFCVIIVVLHAATVNAKGLQNDLNHFFDQMGIARNVTASQAVLGQQAGFYTGGQLFARTPVRDMQPINITLPHAQGGCGGIDLYLGSFSFINKTEFIQMLKLIMNNAAGYAFKLGLKTITPQIENTVSELQKTVNQLNQFNINSCEMATEMVGGLWPKSQKASEQICQDLGAQDKGLFRDWAEGRHQCQQPKVLAKTLAQAQQSDYYKAQLPVGVNLAWAAMDKSHFLKSDRSLREFLMTLTGTLVMPDPTTQKGEVPYILPAKSRNKKLLKALLYGGKAPIYQCDKPERCLKPTLIKDGITISAKNSLKNRVETLIRSMVEKIQTDTVLSPVELSLLQSTHLPLYKLLNVQTAFHHGQVALAIDAYSEVIAIDLLFQYIEDNLTAVSEQTAGLLFPPELTQKFQTQLAEVRAQVVANKKSLFHDLSLGDQMIAQTQTMEKMLVGQWVNQLMD